MEILNDEPKIGRVLHYYPKIGVAVVEFEDKINPGEKIHIKGEKTDFVQSIESMQVEHTPIAKAEKGDKVGLKVIQPVKEGDIVYRV